MKHRTSVIGLLWVLACEAPAPQATSRSAVVPGPGIPNTDRPASELHQRISPIMGTRPFNQPGVINGTLFLAGNAMHELWNVSNPAAPVRMSELISPHARGEAESHQISFARFEDGSLHAVTISGRGIDLWNVSDPSAPILESSLELFGVDYGDFTEAVWGVFWQGHYIFAGGTNTGLHVIDATDPAAPRIVRRLGSTALGGISAGPLFALGNLLVVTTPKENAGIATVDIGAPDDPILLDALTSNPRSYIGGFFGIHAHLVSPFRSFDVLSDPADIRLTGTAETPPSEYLSFGDGNLFLGSLRRTAGGVTGVLEYDLSNLDQLTLLAHVRGRDLLSDDQFSLPVGNLLVVADDERGYGAYLAVRRTERDTTGPSVIAAVPRDGAIDQPLTTRIGLSLSDVVELTSASIDSVELRPLGGAPVEGRFGVSGTVLSFSPSAPLLPETTYELRVLAGGLTDFSGNAVPVTWQSTFTTRAAGAGALPCEIVRAPPVVIGAAASLAAAAPDDARFTYAWSFGDGAGGAGAAVSHVYAAPGRLPVTLTVSERPSAATRWDPYEAEEAGLAGGVRARSDNAGFNGTGYADFPALPGTGAQISWSDVRAARTGAHELVIRYANGDTSTRRLELFTNGVSAGVIDFAPLGSWTVWGEVRVSLSLAAGLNTLELRAGRSAGPNVDRLELSVLRATSCSATQIVHRVIPQGPGPARSSSILAAGGQIWTVNPDHGSVSVIDAAAAVRTGEVTVGGRPRTLARAPDGTIWVAVSETDAVVIVEDGAVAGSIELPAGSAPHGIVFSPDGSRAFVSLEQRGEVVALDPATRQLRSRAELRDEHGRPAPVRGLAITGDGRRLFVTRFVSPVDHGEIYELDPETMVRVRTISLAPSMLSDTPDEGRGVPNYLGAIAINPDGTEAWLPSKQDNTFRGLARDGEALTHDATVRPILSRIDLAASRETLERRVDLNDASMPVAAELSPLGDLVFIAVQGSNKIEVRETYGGRIIGSISAGRAPEGLVLDGDRLYVQDFLDRTVTIASAGAFLSGEDSVAPVIATVPSAAREVLSPEVLRGKQLFYDASDRRMAKEGYISCAACHLDGKEDGRVWDFTDRGEGLRNTISLEGRAGTGHGAVHWTANFDEIQDFEHDLRGPFGGTGLMDDADFHAGTRSDALGDPKAGVSAELDALAAYVTSLDRIPDSPYRAADGSLTADGQAGKRVFFSAGCDGCHVPPRFTDGKTYDVGTLRATSGQRRGEALAGIDTPTLLGVFATPPYLHDGSAPTLAEVLENPLHGDAARLDAEDRRVLIAYLEQLDAREAGATEPEPDPEPDPEPEPRPIEEPEPPGAAPPDEGCACTAAAPPTDATPVLGLLLLALAGRRKR